MKTPRRHDVPSAAVHTEHTRTRSIALVKGIQEVTVSREAASGLDLLLKEKLEGGHDRWV